MADVFLNALFICLLFISLLLIFSVVKLLSEYSISIPRCCFAEEKSSCWKIVFCEHVFATSKQKHGNHHSRSHNLNIN